MISSSEQGHNPGPVASGNIKNARAIPSALALGVAVVLLAVAAMINGLSGKPVLDDYPEILGNPNIRFLGTEWSFFRSGYYLPTRPLPYLTFGFDFQIWGTNFAGYHATSIFVHVCAAVLLFLLVREVARIKLKPANAEETGDALAFSIAALWAVHPLQTFAVTYVYQRMETMMALFFLLSVYFFFRSRRSKKPAPWLVGSVVAAMCSVGSKEIGAVIPFVILSADLFVLRNPLPTVIRERWLFYLGLVSTWFLLALILISHGTSYDVRANRPEWWEYFLTQPEVILFYLQQSVWPTNLSFDWGWPIQRNPLLIVSSVFAVGMLVLISVVTMIRGSVAGWLGFCFFVILAPTSSVLVVADVANLYRMYLPLAAVSAVIVLAGWRVYGILMERIPARAQIIRWVGGGLLALSLWAFSSISNHRNALFHDPVALWTEAAEKAPHHSRPLGELSVVELKRGNSERSLRFGMHALQLDPGNFGAIIAVASILGQMGRLEEAESYLEMAADPVRAPAQLFAILGNLKQKTDPEKADSMFEIALEKDPANFTALNNLANSHARRGNYAEAVPLYRRALLTLPNDSQTVQEYRPIIERNLNEAVRLARPSTSPSQRE